MKATTEGWVTALIILASLALIGSIFLLIFVIKKKREKEEEETKTVKAN